MLLSACTYFQKVTVFINNKNLEHFVSDNALNSTSEYENSDPDRGDDQSKRHHNLYLSNTPPSSTLDVPPQSKFN